MTNKTAQSTDREAATRHPLARTFQGMKQRCNNPNNAKYKNYGGRGIRVEFQSASELLAELGPRPSPEHTVDRYPDRNGNYKKGNVRWATKSEQCRNTIVGRIICVDGICLKIREWAERQNIRKGAIENRIYSGWCDTCAVTLPVAWGNNQNHGTTCPHKREKANEIK